MSRGPRWTESDIQTMRDMRLAGKTFRQIAFELGRSREAVQDKSGLINGAVSISQCAIKRTIAHVSDDQFIRDGRRLLPGMAARP